MGGSTKQPKQSQNPSALKVAKHARNPEGYQDKIIGWHFQCMDTGGKWKCDCNVIDELIPMLCDYENMTWQQAEERHHTHPMPIDRICEKAKNRLVKIGFEDAATLYQFEMPGRGARRLWGFRQQNILQLLWWDPEHTVYPINR